MSISLLISCKKDQPGATVYNASDIYQNFCKGMEDRYLYWNTESVDWKLRTSQYKTVFATLDLNNIEQQKQGVKILKDMVRDLKDGHLSIVFSPAAIQDSVIFTNRISERVSSFNYSSLIKQYFPEPSIRRVSKRIDSFTEMRLIFAEKANVGYIGLNFFSISRFLTNDDPQVKPLIDSFKKFLQSEQKDSKMILDLRGCSGGDLADLKTVISPLIAEQVSGGYYRYKLGAFSFSPLLPISFSPINGKTFTGKILVLTDSNTASLAETIVLIMRSQKNVIVVGEKTLGATGAVLKGNLSYSGPFDVGNFMKVRLSSAEFLTMDENSLEGEGIRPGIFIENERKKLENGEDQVLKYALED